GVGPIAAWLNPIASVCLVQNNSPKRQKELSNPPLPRKPDCESAWSLSELLVSRFCTERPPQLNTQKWAAVACRPSCFFAFNELLPPCGERIAEQAGIDFRLCVEDGSGHIAAGFDCASLLAVIAGDSADRVVRAEN